MYNGFPSGMYFVTVGRRQYTLYRASLSFAASGTHVLYLLLLQALQKLGIDFDSHAYQTCLLRSSPSSEPPRRNDQRQVQWSQGAEP